MVVPEVVPSPHQPKPWHADALRLHNEQPSKHAHTVSLELERLGHPGITGRQVDELWREVE